MCDCVSGSSGEQSEERKREEQAGSPRYLHSRRCGQHLRGSWLLGMLVIASHRLLVCCGLSVLAIVFFPLDPSQGCFHLSDLPGPGILPAHPGPFQNPLQLSTACLMCLPGLFQGSFQLVPAYFICPLGPPYFTCPNSLVSCTYPPSLTCFCLLSLVNPTSVCLVIQALITCSLQGLS